MPGKQAKIITEAMLAQALQHVSQSSFRALDRALILLSVKAGLRAAEIAYLTWPMVLDARGRVSDTLCVRDSIAKRQGGRNIPAHPLLHEALACLRCESGPAGPVIMSARRDHLRPNSIVNWFAQLYAELGFEGCSSHSGRRTFITKAARNAHKAGCSLRDVQILAGNQSLMTTERYIDGDSASQRRLVACV